MIYETLIPQPPLNQFVEWLWFYGDHFPGHAREIVLPHGCSEWIIDLREGPKRWFDREDPSRSRGFRGSWVAGAFSEHIVIETTQGSSMMGVHFKPGGAYPLLGFPARELANNVEAADALMGAKVAVLREELIDLPSPSRKLERLQRFLLCEARRPWSLPPLVQGALREFEEHPSEAAVARFCARAGVSGKHLIEQFNRWVGLTPKRYCRVRRFQRVLREIERTRCVVWADVAADCGYFDQAHFIRDFQAFSGMNPSRYLRETRPLERGEWLTFLPVNDR